MKNLSYKIIILCVIAPVVCAYSQADRIFYYYKNEKIFLDLDLQRIAISWEGDSVSVLQRFSRETIFNIKKDVTRQRLENRDSRSLARNSIRTYYFEVFNENRIGTSYGKEIKNLRTIQNVIMASPCFKDENGKRMGLSNNFYVKLKQETDLTLLHTLADEWGFEVLGNNKFMPLWFTVACGKKSSVNSLEAANIFYELNLFESCEPEFIYYDITLSSDTFFSNQWGVKNTGQYGTSWIGIDVNAEQAWDAMTKSNASINKVAIYDHGFEMNHPDLQANNFGTGYDANSGSSPAQVRGNHGTATAGIVGAVQNNNIGITGVAPKAKLISISINLNGDPPQELADGFNWAAENDVDVISNSYGGYSPSSMVNDAITNVLTNGRNGKGTVVVFSAGNDNNTNVKFPANSNPLIIVVGALSPCGERKSSSSCDGENWWGSTYGNLLDVMAPGVKIYTTDRQGTNGYSSSNYTTDFNGTSAACPHVAGVASIILSANPELTVQQVSDIIEKSAKKVRPDLYTYTNSSGRPNGTWNERTGYGLVDAGQAFALAENYCMPDEVWSYQIHAPYISNRQAANTIITTNIIDSGAGANFKAGTSITFLPGFIASSGSTLRAYIDACDPITGSEDRLASDPYVSEVMDKSDQIRNATDAKHITGLSVFPNPTTGILNVVTSLPDNTSGNFIIYNSRGEIAFESPKIKIVKENFQIDTNSFRSGLYMLYLKTDQSLDVVKFIVK